MKTKLLILSLAAALAAPPMIFGAEPAGEGWLEAGLTSQQMADLIEFIENVK